MTLYTLGTPDATLDPAPAVATLESMAQSLLTITESVALAKGVPLPDRRVIYMAPIPADCPQVAVLVGGWSPEPPWQGLAGCLSARWVAQLGVIITRVTPAKPSAAGDLPRPSDLAAATHLASEDAEVLLEVAGSLGEIAGDVLVATPAAEGGLQSVTLTVRTPAFGGL